MPVIAQIQFVQPGGGGTGTPGQALIGLLALPVTVNNSNNSQVATSTFEVIDAPPGSIIPVGVVQTGSLKSFVFTPDLRGGYEFHLTTTDVFGNFAEDFRVFQVLEVTGRLIPPFKADAVSLNFGGQKLGWAPYLRAYLAAIDAGLGPGSVPIGRTLTAGTGLTGGGDLSANRTFNVVANADGSIVANADDVQVGVLASDAQHGVRGGGLVHALVVPAGAAGFMSGVDKTKLDGVPSGGGNKYIQAAFAQITVDTTTNSAVFVTLLSTTFTKVALANLLILHLTGGASNSNNNVSMLFRIQIDGVTQRGVATPSVGTGNLGSFALVFAASGVAVGLRTITVQWRTTGGTTSIRPVASPDSEHCSLLLGEVTP